MIALEKAGDEIARRAIERRNKENPVESNWPNIARPDQIRPEGADIFTLIGGRGSGKTRAGAEDTLARVRAGSMRVHVLAPTFADGRDVCIEGDSGILACALPGEVANWNRSMGELFFANGSKLKIFAACEPDRLNGPQCQTLWADEFGLYGDTAAIDMALFGLRLGDNVSSCWTSTPKMTRSTKYVLKYTEDMGGVRRRMRTRDNAANLAKGVVDALERKYGGTRLGRAELDGEDIEDVEGALWQSAWFQKQGFRKSPVIFKENGQVVVRVPENIIKIVVGLDPTVSDPEKKKNPHKDPDACGVVVAGVDGYGWGHVFADYTAIMAPADWAKLALRLYTLFKANAIVAEANQGGELIAEVLKGYGTANVQLVHASMGKRPRAEPVAMLYEQCLVGETLVSTEQGAKSIKDVAIGERVHTRYGLRRVLFSGLMGVKETITLELSNGTRITCTDDHKIWTQNRGWVKACEVKPHSDILLECCTNAKTATKGYQGRVRGASLALRGIAGKLAGSLSASSSNSKASSITHTPRGTGEQVTIKGQLSCIVPSMRHSTGRSDRDGISIISTGTPRTTLSRICRRYHLRNTPGSILASYTPQRREQSVPCLKRDSQQNVRSSLESAYSAATRLSRARLTRSIAVPSMSEPITLVCSEPGLKLPVYDLTVEEHPEFFANGILVHNSRVHHYGEMRDMEDQMATWDATDPSQKSPNNIDALVWTFHGLGLCDATGTRVRTTINNHKEDDED